MVHDPQQAQDDRLLVRERPVIPGAEDEEAQQYGEPGLCLFADGEPMEPGRGLHEELARFPQGRLHGRKRQGPHGRMGQRLSQGSKACPLLRQGA